MSEVVSRRFFVTALTAMAAVPLTRKAPAAALSGPSPNNEVSIENFSAAGVSQGFFRVAKVMKTDAEWQAQLSPLAYRVARQADTERGVSGGYRRNHGGRILPWQLLR